MTKKGIYPLEKNKIFSGYSFEVVNPGSSKIIKSNPEMPIGHRARIGHPSTRTNIHETLVDPRAGGITVC